MATATTTAAPMGAATGRPEDMDVHARLDDLLLAVVVGLVTVLLARSAHMRQHEETPGETQRRRRASSMHLTSSQVLPSAEALPANILAGVVAGLKQSLGCVVFSSMVYSSCEQCFPNLLAVFPKGLSVNLMSSTVGVVLCTTMSKYRGLVSPQDIPAMLLSRIAEVLARRVNEDSFKQEQLEHTVLACTWLNALVFGVLCCAAGYMRAGRVVRNIPCPVVDGFVAATGAMAVRSALSSLCRTSFHSLWPTNLSTFASLETWLHMLIGFLSLACIRYGSYWVKDKLRGLKWKALNTLLNPLALLMPLIIFYICLALRGHIAEDLAWLREHHWVYPEVTQQPFWKFYSECWPRSHLSQVAYYELLQTEVLLLMAMLQFLSLIAAVLNIMGIKTRREANAAMDLDKEIFYLGVQNLIIGMAGGTPSFHQLSMSVNIGNDGGTHKIADFVCSIFTGVVFLSGFPVSPYIPKFFLAAIFLNLGVQLLKSNMLDQFRRVSSTDFGTTLVVVLLAMTKDMTWAVGGGCILQVAILVMISSTMDPIRDEATTNCLMSTKMRTDQERNWLIDKKGVLVVFLRGPLFFGVAENLVAKVEDLIDGLHPEFHDINIKHLILDLMQVTYVDHSAAEAFRRISRSARGRQIELHMVGAGEWKWLLVREGLVSKWSVLREKRIGVRVRRGRDWKWGDLDGGYGWLGTTVDDPETDPGYVMVRWDNGGDITPCRVGAEGCYDLEYQEDGNGRIDAGGEVARRSRATSHVDASSNTDGYARLGIASSGCFRWADELRFSPADDAQDQQDACRWFYTLNFALKECEDDILDDHDGDYKITTPRDGRARTERTDPGQPQGRRLRPASNYDNLLPRNIFEIGGMKAEEWEDLRAECEPNSVWPSTHRKGDLIYLEGEECQCVYILTRGCLKITPKRGLGRGGSRLVNALALIGYEALVMKAAYREESAVVWCECDEVEVLKLRKERLDSMRRNKQELYIAFTDFAVRSLCLNRAAITE